MKPFLQKVSVKDFGPLRDASIELTRLHALIGPNDTGKSMLLRAIRLGSTWLQRPNATRSPHEGANTSLRVVASDGGEWTVRREQATNALSGRARRPDADPSSAMQAVGAVLSSVRVLRLDPDEIRAPTPLLSDTADLDFANERGRGLGAVLDALFSRRSTTYLELQKQLVELFPTVQDFRLFTTQDGRQVGVRLKNGVEVRPEAMSEGMLYFLAFAVVPYIQPSSILLIEEPENGLHPARIAEVMRVLRALSESQQVIIATHSPLVVNELRPEEITVVTRHAERGTQCTAMRDTKNFEERSKVYALGELWLSYANGIDEAALLDGRE